MLICVCFEMKRTHLLIRDRCKYQDMVHKHDISRKQLNLWNTNIFYSANDSYGNDQMWNRFLFTSLDGTRYHATYDDIMTWQRLIILYYQALVFSCDQLDYVAEQWQSYSELHCNTDWNASTVTYFRTITLASLIFLGIWFATSQYLVVST